jgi:hypothetical protein
MRRFGAILVVGMSLQATAALALPPNVRLTLPPGGEKFFRVPFDVVDLVSEPEGVVSAELLPSKEIYITARPGAQGSTSLLVVGADGLFAADICVTKCLPDTNIQSAKAACPTLAQATEDGKPVWNVDVKDVKCLDALRDALAHAMMPKEQLHIVLEETVYHAWVQRILSAITADKRTAGVDAAYGFATLTLKGEAPRSAVSRALVHAYLQTVGSVSFDDQTTQPSTEDAGPPATLK